MEEARDVDRDVFVRMVERIADPCECGQVADAIATLYRFRNRFAIEDIAADERPSLLPLKVLQTSFLEFRIVIRTHIIEPDDFVAAFEKLECCVIADEARGSGEKYFHEGRV